MHWLHWLYCAVTRLILRLSLCGVRWRNEYTRIGLTHKTVLLLFITLLQATIYNDQGHLSNKYIEGLQLLYHACFGSNGGGGCAARLVGGRAVCCGCSAAALLGWSVAGARAVCCGCSAASARAVTRTWRACSQICLYGLLGACSLLRIYDARTDRGCTTVSSEWLAIA